MTVLLIDDDPEEYELFCKAFEEFDGSVSCIHAQTCDEGYQKLKDNLPHCIILDFNLPGKNGLICLRKIKKSDTFQHIPVYIFSDSILEETIIELCLKAGAQRCIRKPSNFKGYIRVFSEIRNGD